MGGAYCYFRRQPVSEDKDDPLQKSLLDGDELEMGSLGPNVPHTSQPDIPHTSQPDIPHTSPPLDMDPNALNPVAASESRKGSVRKIDRRGMNYPTARVAAVEAESYSKISTVRYVLDETIPDDSSSDDESGPDPNQPTEKASGGATAAGRGVLTTSEFTMSQSPQLTTSEFSLPHTGGAMAINLPHTGGAMAITSKVCKVLVTGEMCADTPSIQAALEQAEQDIRDHYRKDHVTMEITMKPLTVREITRSLDDHLPASELSQYNVVIIAVDARPMYLSLFGGGACVDQLMEKFVLFGIPEMAIYFVATGDKAAKVHATHTPHRFPPRRFLSSLYYIYLARLLTLTHFSHPPACLCLCLCHRRWTFHPALQAPTP
jgi:hypothetical protein